MFAVKVRRKGEPRYRFLSSIHGETSHLWAKAVMFGRQVDAQTMVDNITRVNPELEFMVAKRPARKPSL